MANSGLTSYADTSTSLLRRVQARDADAWNRLTELYGPLVYYWCRQSGLRQVDSADVFQDVFASVASSIAGFQRRANGSFRGWLWTITRNKLHDFFRQQQRQERVVGGSGMLARLSALPELPADESSSEFDQEVERKRLLHRGLELIRAEFEPHTWEAFWRTVVDGRPPADVAAELDMTPNSVRQAKSRVLRKLREELGELLE